MDHPDEDGEVMASRHPQELQCMSLRGDALPCWAAGTPTAPPQSGPLGLLLHSPSCCVFSQFFHWIQINLDSYLNNSVLLLFINLCVDIIYSNCL